MKRIIAVIVISVILTALSICTQLTTEYTANRMLYMLSQAEENPQYQTEEYTKKISARWEQYQKFIMTYASHDDLENISMSVNLLAQYLECGETDKFRIECKNAQNAIKHFEHSEKLSIENIF